MRVKKFLSLLLISVLALSLTYFPPTVKAGVEDVDWSFDNPIEFYSQMNDYGYTNKFICVNGNIYFAEKSKLAASGTKWRYQTVGYNIQVNNDKNGYSMDIDIARAPEGVINESKYTAYTPVYKESNDGYYYGVEIIPYKSIIEQCTNKNESLAKKVFENDNVRIVINPIMSKKLYGVIQGGVTEQKNSKGEKIGEVKNTPAASGGENYHLKNDSDLKSFTSFFTSFNKNEMTDIEGNAKNFNIQLSYYVAPGTTTKYTTKSNGYIDFGSDKTYTLAKLFGKYTLPTASNLGLSYKGYHLVSGKEWIYTKTNKTYKAGATYCISDIDSEIKKMNTTGNFKANWEPNKYTVTFDKNGGTGSMSSKSVKYDSKFIVPQNEFKRTGYDFVGWRIKENGAYLSPSNYVTSSSMVSGSNLVYNGGLLEVKNLTATNGGTVTLIAQWKPKTYQVSLNKNLSIEELMEDTSTNEFYSTYNSYFSLNSNGSNKTTKIGIPSKIGYDFIGYYENSNCTGTLMIDSAGNIKFSNTYLTADKIIHGKWKAKTFKLTLDANTTEKQGANVANGSQNFNVTYDQPLPTPLMPTTVGYTFKGYFTEKNGQGTCYYTPYMAPTVNVSKFLKDTTLYAYWVDEVRPTTLITAESSGWTNSTDNIDNGQTDDGYKIIFECNDKGSGIAKMEIYKEDKYGVFQLVKSSANVKETITETKEGVYRYKVIATDKAGNKSVDRFCTIYYDKTSPKIVEATGDMNSLTNVSGKISATDNEETN